MNIIVTEREKVIVKDLDDKFLIKVYMWYVVDTLLLVKVKDIKLIHKRLNFFNKNMKFLIDNFSGGNVHFTDVQIEKNHASIYYKPTHIGQYIQFHSQTPCPIKAAWVKALFHRTKEYAVPMLDLMNKLRISKNLCPGFYTLNKHETPYWKN